MLDEDAVALTQSVPLDELRAGLGDHTDVLVTHDHGCREGRVGVHLHVGATDASDLDAQQRTIGRQVRSWELLDLGASRRRAHRGTYSFDHVTLPASRLPLGEGTMV